MQSKKTPEQISTEMDEAAYKAQEDLGSLDSEAVKVVTAWWEKWYRRAGHKRLGRVLLGKM